MKIKTAELVGPPLDRAVARCQYPKSAMSCTHVWILTDPFSGEDDFLIEKYSTDWSQGGPIIDKEDIGFIKCNPLYFPKGDAKGVPGCDYYQPYIKAVIGVNAEYGPTKLIAAMRCYAASKLGDEVDIPQDLT